MRLGIISDIHEDAVSLKNAINRLEKLNCNEIACLGDIVGLDRKYYSNVTNPDPIECVNIVQNNCKFITLGNHDLNAIKKFPNSLSQFSYPDNWYSLTQEEKIQISKKKVWVYSKEENSIKLTDNQIAFLSSVPEYIITELNSKNIMLSHSTYPDFTGCLSFRPHNPWDIKKHLKFLKDNHAVFGFSGHTHPNGLLKINYEKMKLVNFNTRKLDHNFHQYFCPCIANGTSKNGFIVVDFLQEQIEINSLKTSSNKIWVSLYERFIKKNQK